jgi:very-short-patch-repair endonuclease
MGVNNQKFSQEFVEDYFKEKGCTLVDEYVNSTTPLNYICKCGTPRKITFSKFKAQKHGCRVCNGLEKYSQSEIENLFKENKCKLISIYTGANDILEYICECGNKSTTTLSNFKKGKRCVQCGLNKLAEQFKHDILFIKNYFIENNCTPLFEEYNSVHEPLDYVCECGNKSKIAFADFQYGKRCDECRVERIQKTMYKHGTQQCSSQQKYLHDLFGGELNFPVNSSTLDIAFPEDKLYIEYDGSGHDLSVKLGNVSQESFDNKEKNRRYSLYRQGWNEIRIISRKDYLPNNTTLLEMISFAKAYFNTKHSWIVFDIDNKTVKSSQFDNEYNYGQIKRLKINNIS